jgi:hypothetical protein
MKDVWKEQKVVGIERTFAVTRTSIKPPHYTYSMHTSTQLKAAHALLESCLNQINEIEA